MPNPSTYAASGYFSPQIFAPAGRLNGVQYLGAHMIVFLPLLLIMALLGFGFVSGTASAFITCAVSVLVMLLLVLALVFLLILARRRLQDLNQPGIFALVMLIPLVNMIAFIYFIFAKGSNGINAHGAKPIAATEFDKTRALCSIVLLAMLLGLWFGV